MKDARELSVIKFEVGILMEAIPTDEVGQSFTNDFFDSVNEKVKELQSEEDDEGLDFFVFKPLCDFKVDDDLSQCAMIFTGGLLHINPRVISLALTHSLHEFIQSIEGAHLESIEITTGMFDGLVRKEKQ